MGITRALSIKQPWLWAICTQGKTIENRSWRPPDWIIGQTIAIHASKTIDKAALPWFKHTMWVDVPADLPTGAIVAVAKITGYCEAAKDNPWFIGPYGWQLTEVLELAAPIPCKGALGLWRLEDQLQRKLKSAILETVY